MKLAYLLFVILVPLVPQFAKAKLLSENTSFSSDSQRPNSTSCLKDLEELGYCVIPRVISDDEAKDLYLRVWHEFIEKAWPNCKMDNIRPN